jgi:hypothetical protein
MYAITSATPSLSVYIAGESDTMWKCRAVPLSWAAHAISTDLRDVKPRLAAEPSMPAYQPQMEYVM